MMVSGGYPLKLVATLDRLVRDAAGCRGDGICDDSAAHAGFVPQRG
jgi:hypothetical protein